METVIQVIVSMCFVTIVIFMTQMLRLWVHKKRHIFRKKGESAVCDKRSQTISELVRQIVCN